MRMGPEHVEPVALIHELSWSPNEISVKLGAEYLRLFYTSVVESEYSFGYVYTLEGQVVSYAIGFYDYQAFNQSVKSNLRSEFFIILVKRLLIAKISWSDIVNLFNDSKKLSKTKYPKYHLGALALANKYKSTASGREAITASIIAVLEDFECMGYPGCWGLCDARNMPMRKYLLKLHFEEVDVIDFLGKSVVLYEKSFKAFS